MDPNVLRDHLTKLHDELGATLRAEEPASKQLLGEIMEDIQRLMQAADAPKATDAPTGVVDSQTSLRDRLEKIAVLFEVDHPTLAASSRRLVDVLGKLGL